MIQLYRKYMMKEMEGKQNICTGEPVFSIVMPVYQAEQFLSARIENLLSQTFEDFELILVNDGSTDAGAVFCDSYADKDVRVRVVHQTNQGVSAAKNAGLAQARGRYIWFADCDDTSSPAFLEKVYPELENGADAVSVNRTVIDADGIRTEYSRKYEVLTAENDEERLQMVKDVAFRKEIAWENWALVFRRSLITENHIRFPEKEISFGEDMYFTFCCLLHIRKLVLLPDDLYTYRRREGSLSDRYGRNVSLTVMNRNAELLYQYCKKAGNAEFLLKNFPLLWYTFTEREFFKGAVMLEKDSRAPVRQIYTEQLRDPFAQRMLGEVMIRRKELQRLADPWLFDCNMNLLAYLSGRSYPTYFIHHIRNRAKRKYRYLTGKYRG